MPRESVARKGRRYLLEGRLAVLEVSGDVIEAECRGGGEVYALGHAPKGGWWCSCPARTNCAHLVALQLVTVRRHATSRPEQSQGSD